ncbi:zinc metalloproteinase nas-14-like isoform X2 [Mercenaria mercenaria]|uniref:zinc metalloproteinase nas-14-like isoform X2 n=1 Tax=Mercenaria mercenaria TaxID=6596 RepID=UPI00234EF596|nr:zinc metalloproteinase nas-14-like isoform X2 [Mercenaria mercenaria]
MVPGPINIFPLIPLTTICVLPSTESFPMRVNEIAFRPLPIYANSPLRSVVPSVNPDPLENIGVEFSQGYLMEGDIRIWEGFNAQENTVGSSSQTVNRNPNPNTNSKEIRNSLRSEKLWTEKVIPYEIDQTFDSREKMIIIDAINDVMTGVNRCIIFVPREKQEDFVYISGQERGCWSSVGKRGGNQTVSISRRSGCTSKGIIMHELLHALGLWHEHSRADRDKYIEILQNNIRPDYLRNFKIKKGKLLTAYDYYSIMHYKTNQFSKCSRSLKTIRVIQPGIDETKVGQREQLSDKDKEKITTLYQCKKRSACPISSIQTQQYSADKGITIGIMTGNQTKAFRTVPGNQRNPLGAMFTFPVSNNKERQQIFQ